MGRSSFAELTDKIVRCIGIGKEPPDNGASCLAPKLAALWPDAVPRVKFIYFVEQTYETAKWNNRIYKAQLRGLSAFVVAHLRQSSIGVDWRKEWPPKLHRLTGAAFFLTL
jgi:hypothetical protein